LRDADHSFHVLVRGGRTDTELLNDLLNTLGAWVKDVVANTGSASGG
jgi:hypothetical protein